MENFNNKPSLFDRLSLLEYVKLNNIDSFILIFKDEYLRKGGSTINE